MEHLCDHLSSYELISVINDYDRKTRPSHWNLVIIYLTLDYFEFRPLHML